MTNQEKSEVVELRKKDSWETLWRNIMYVLIAITIYSVPGFLSFRDLAAEKGYHFVSAQAWWWAVLSFTVYGVLSCLFSVSNTLTFT